MKFRIIKVFPTPLPVHDSSDQDITGISPEMVIIGLLTSFLFMDECEDAASDFHLYHDELLRRMKPEASE